MPLPFFSFAIEPPTDLHYFNAAKGEKLLTRP
jgi:hypothetical protein